MSECNCFICSYLLICSYPLHFFLLQSNKKEKEAAPTETKNKKVLGKPVTLDSSEKPRLSSSQPQLQPQPPSSPAHNESRRGSGKGERGVKRCLKNKAAPVDYVGVKGAGDGPVTTMKPVAATTDEQQHQEPSAKRTTVLCDRPKTTKEPASEADGETHSVKSAVANSKAPHTHPPASPSPQMQRRDGDKGAERLGSSQEQEPGVTAASHSNKTQVRKVSTSCFAEHSSCLALI